MSPPEINDATLELLERRIADRVTEQARSRVFAYYVVIGTTISTILGLLGWSALSWIERRADTEISEQIEKKTEKVSKASERLDALQTRMDAQLQALDTLAVRAGRIVDRVDTTLASFEPKSRRLEQAISDIDELEERVRPIRGAADLSERNQIVIQRIGNELLLLAQQVKELIEVNRTMRPEPAAAQAYVALAGTAERVTAAAESITRDVDASRTRSTVYLQFAGITREQADSIRNALASAQFQLPAAERTGNAVGLFEVRYFYPGDEASARKLAEAATAASRRIMQNESRDAKLVPLLNFRGTKPREGTLELWYGPSR